MAQHTAPKPPADWPGLTEERRAAWEARRARCPEGAYYYCSHPENKHICQALLAQSAKWPRRGPNGPRDEAEVKAFSAWRAVWLSAGDMVSTLPFSLASLPYISKPDEVWAKLTPLFDYTDQIDFIIQFFIRR